VGNLRYRQSQSRRVKNTYSTARVRTSRFCCGVLAWATCVSKGFALTWYRALTWYILRVSSLRTHFEPWTAVVTLGGGVPLLPSNE